MGSAQAPLKEAVQIEGALLRVPVEELKRLTRAQAKLVERELAVAGKAAAALAAGAPGASEAAAKAAERLRAVVRKVRGPERAPLDREGGQRAGASLHRRAGVAWRRCPFLPRPFLTAWLSCRGAAQVEELGRREEAQLARVEARVTHLLACAAEDAAGATAGASTGPSVWGGKRQRLKLRGVLTPP